MPAPTTVPELLDRVRHSGLVPADRLDAFLAGLRSLGRYPSVPSDLLDRLVDAGLLTRFQADKLAVGKYKGFQLGGYLILDQLGTGGMGQVYLAEHVTMQRLVALKVLPVFSADDVVARERFFREARAAATLDHPNIVRVFDMCQEGKLLYLVMEYVEGTSLQSLVARHGPLEVGAACHYARQAAFGLQHAHDLGFVHRDVKPANLLVDRAGVVKLVDFGLVRSEADAGAGLTRQLDNRSTIGTADYVAPEQALDGSNVDTRADIYSLGATFYFLLAGRTLFPEGRTAQKLVWQQVKDPTPITRLRPEVPAELAELVHTMLRNAAEVFDALAPWTADPIPPPAEALMPRVSARVALARSSAAAAVAARRAAGSASHVVATAMRAGPLSGGSGTRRALPAGGSSVLAPLPDPARAPDSSVTVAAESMEDTPHASRRPDRPRQPPARAEVEPTPVCPRRKWATVAALLAAAALAGLGLAILVS
jgi:serine/threonine protein kinase